MELFVHFGWSSGWVSFFEAEGIEFEFHQQLGVACHTWFPICDLHFPYALHASYGSAVYPVRTKNSSCGFRWHEREREREMAL